MNTYLLGIRNMTKDKYEEYEFEGENKKDAIEKFNLYVRMNPHFSWHDYNINDIICIKKLNTKKKDK